MKMPISAEETMLFQEGLFILLLLGTEEPACKKREKKNEMMMASIRPITTAKIIPFFNPLSPHDEPLKHKRGYY
jgi:hypothetical protein